MNGVNLSRNSFIVQDETASVVHGFTTAGTGVRDLNLILLIRSSAAILVCGSLRCLSALSPILRTVNIKIITVYINSVPRGHDPAITSESTPWPMQ